MTFLTLRKQFRKKEISTRNPMIKSMEVKSPAHIGDFRALKENLTEKSNSELIAECFKKLYRKYRALSRNTSKDPEGKALNKDY